MAKTASNMLPLGTKAPQFNLYDTISNSNISLETIDVAKGLVVLFICNHCPYVIHLNSKLVDVANEYQNKGFGTALINQLLLNSKKPLIFKVSINNTISSNFLMKFVNIGVLSFQKDKSNLVFKSI